MMALLTLPPWIKEGQTVQSAYPPLALMHNPGIWTIAAVQDLNSWYDSFVRIERTTDTEYRSEWIVLDVLLRDWRPA